MFEIHSRPVRDVRNKYSELAQIVREHNDVIITNKGKAELVLVNPVDWKEFKEYRYSRYV